MWPYPIPDTTLFPLKNWKESKTKIVPIVKSHLIWSLEHMRSQFSVGNVAGGSKNSKILYIPLSVHLSSNYCD